MVTANSDMPGTDSSVRSSTRSSLRSSAPTVAAIPGGRRRRRDRPRRGDRARRPPRCRRARASALIGRAPRSPPRRRRAAARSSAARPARRPSTTSASASPPPGSWLQSTRVRPLPAPISGSTSSTAAGSRFACGSSSSSSSGSCSTARATATRWTIPRESVRSGSSRAVAHRHRLQQLLDALLRRRRAGARGSAGSRAPSARGRAAARGRAGRSARAPPRPPAGRLEPEHAHAARMRAQQRREDPQQRRLAGAVGTEHDQRLPRRRATARRRASASRSP